MPPETGRHSTDAPAAGAGHTSRRTFFRPARMSSAAGSNPGAMTTSVNTSAICAARSAVTIWLAAMTPPNADSGSQAFALRCASARSAPVAMPHGLECFMIATHGAAKSKAARRAASAST